MRRNKGEAREWDRSWGRSQVWVQMVIYKLNLEWLLGCFSPPFSPLSNGRSRCCPHHASSRDCDLLRPIIPTWLQELLPFGLAVLGMCSWRSRMVVEQSLTEQTGISPAGKERVLDVDGPNFLSSWGLRSSQTLWRPHSRGGQETPFQLDQTPDSCPL